MYISLLCGKGFFKNKPKPLDYKFILNYEEFLWKKRDQALPFVVAL